MFELIQLAIITITVVSVLVLFIAMFSGEMEELAVPMFFVGLLILSFVSIENLRLKDCEQNLPRNQRCELVAVPVEVVKEKEDE